MLMLESRAESEAQMIERRCAPKVSAINRSRVLGQLCPHETATSFFLQIINLSVSRAGINLSGVKLLHTIPNRSKIQLKTALP